MRKIGMWFAVGTVTALCFSPIGAAQTEDEILALEQGFSEAVEALDVDRVLSYFTDDAVYNFVPQPPPMNGKEEIGAFLGGLFQGVPDFDYVERHNQVADNVLVREAVVQGTHLGELSGIPPTGNSLQIMPLHIFEFEGNKIKNVVEYIDMQSLLIQVGVMPAPEIPELKPSFTMPEPESLNLPPVDADIELTARWNAHDFSSYAKLINPEADLWINAFGFPMDRDTFVAAQESYVITFPDKKMEAIRRIDLGDGWIVTEALMSGTHLGPFFGIPATGLSYQNRIAYLARYDSEGLLIFSHIYFDNITVLAQLGLLPEESLSENWELFK